RSARASLPSARMLRVRAGSVHPVTAPPITDGAVLVADDGRITAVAAHAQVPDPPGARRVEFPDAVLVPGLVNAHTHLELTHLAGRNPEREFSRWIRTIRALKDATTPEEFDHSAEQGVRDCWMAGVTCVADTGSTGAPLRALARLGARGIYYQEVSGPDPADGTAPLAALRAAGIPVGLGTDSVVSAGDVNLLAEAAAAGLYEEDALRMLTIEGARALGLDAEIGSLEVGKQADLAVFPSTVFSRPLPTSTALLTIVAGRVVRGYIPAQ